MASVVSSAKIRAGVAELSGARLTGALRRGRLSIPSNRSGRVSRDLSALANASKGSAGPIAAMRATDGNKAGDLSAVTGDRHFLAPFDEIEQLPELISCLEGADFPHWLDRLIWTGLA